MRSVADDARPQAIIGHLLPKIVVMPRQHGMASVAQVRAKARPGRDGFPNPLRQRGRVADGDDDAASAQLANELQRPVVLGGERHQANPAARQFLQEATTGGHAEVTLGRMAANKAASPAVRRFAERMVRERSQLRSVMRRVSRFFEGVGLRCHQNSIDPARRPSARRMPRAGEDRA